MKRVIIVGCGRVGSRIALQLQEEGYLVSVIDRNPIAFKKIEDNFEGKMVIGTGLDEEMLLHAGINEAIALISVAKGDNTNIMVGQIAQFIYKVPKVIVRIVDPKSKKFYSEVIGLTCYCPTEVNVESYIKLMKGEQK